GRQFGVWGLAGGALGALFGGRTGDWLLTRWSGGRVVVSGAGFVLGGPVCAALLLIDELRLFVPLLFGTFFLYSWYNGPLSAVILDVVPAAVRASVLGAYVLFSHLAGDAIAPPLIGYLSDRFGLRPAMLLLPTARAAAGRSAGTPGTGPRSRRCWRCTAIATRARLRRGCWSRATSRSPRRSSRTTRSACRRSPSFVRGRSPCVRRSCGSRSS